MRSLLLAWTFVAARADTCDNTCGYAYDGDCDDGQPGSDYSICACGTDCSDCGSRASCDTSGTNDWGTGNGWCSSDLDDHVGDTSTASACWTECEGRYGSDLVAIDWTPDGECYCQDDCQCMDDADDGDIHLITRSDVASLPDVCISACPAEEAAFEDCLSQQRSLDDAFFSGDDDDDATVGGLLSASEREKCLDCQAGGRGYCVSTGDCAYEMSGACFIDPTGPLGDLCVCGSPHDHIAASEAQLRSFCSAPRWDALLHWDCGVDEWRYDANSGIGTCTADTVWATPANPASSGDDDDDFVPRTCDDGQQWLSKPGGVCQDGPAVCRAEYEAYAVCYYEDLARDELGLACDFTCSASSDSKKRNNAELLIIIIVCSVAAVCCLLALGTAAAFGAFGSCACFAKKKKMRVAEPSEPPLAHATVIAGAPPPAKTQAHMTEGPPSPGPPPLAPIKATETLAAERP